MDNSAQHSILFIEDTPSIVETLVPILEQEGFTVTSVENGKDAIEKLKQNSFDTIISDYRLPDIKGNELIEQIRGISPEISIIFTSGFENAAEALGPLKKEVLDFLSKPIDLEKLFSLLEKTKQLKQNK